MKHILSLLVLFNIITLSAQEKDTILSQDIDEITVESFFFKQKIRSSTSPIGVISAQDLDDRPLQGIGDALKLEAAIAMKSDGIWSTAPSIRGLSGQRIVIAVDGNRIETATDVSGGMNMINMHDISQIDIIKSGASSLYGSGAIGGVINFITQPVTYSSTPEFHAMVSSSYQSVNHLFDEYAKFYGSSEHFFYALSGSFREAQNTMTPVGELENSQFKDYSINLKAGYRINTQQELRFQHQNFQARDVGVPGGASFSTPFTVTFPEHARTMTDLEYRYTPSTEHINLAKIKLYHQNIYRDVFVETNLPMYNGSPVALHPTGEHNIWGALAQTDMRFGDFDMSSGIDIWQRNLHSTREKFISLSDSSEMIRGELPLPEASYMSNGVFVRAQRNFFDDKLKTTIGARYDYIVVNNEEVYDPDYVIKDGSLMDVSRRLTIEADTKNMHSWSANLGANYQVSNEFNVALSGGHSFRAPNIEELYKYINLGASVEIGNPDLLPEESNFADLGLHYKNDQLKLSANGFVNKITNMIASESGTTTYDNYDSDGSVTSTDTLSALILNNIEEALLYGFDMSASYEAFDGFIIETNIAYTIGENLSTDTYLPLIAPINGHLGFSYNAFKYVQGQLDLEWAGKQNKIASGEEATDGYGIINLNLSSMPFVYQESQVQFFAGIHNLFDTEYTNHLSSNRGSVTVEPGRNFYVKVKFTL